MTRLALSSIDRMWLRMEDPTHPMVISVLLIFDAPIEFERLQTVAGPRLLSYSRFRQRVVWPQGDADTPAWEDDPAFALEHHLKQISLPAPGDEAALRALVSELTSRQLDLSRPLWQFHLVASYGTGCALVGRVHHCMADGPALMHLLLALSDAESDTPALVAELGTTPAPVEPERGAASQLVELVMQHGINTLSNPLSLWNLTRLGRGTVTVLGKLVSRRHDPVTVFQGKLSGTKRVAWSSPLALAEVKALGRPAGGTVNDVMLALAAGALQRYLESRGEAVQGLTLRAGLSVNLRDPDAGTSLGNRAGAVLVNLPVGLDSAEARLHKVKRDMDAIKESPEASMVWGLLNALGNAPGEVQTALVERYVARDTAVIANVPGPAQTVSLAGSPLSSLMFWVPALGGAGLCLSIASYTDQVWFGASTDEALVPDPEQIIAGFHAEYDALQGSAPGAESEGTGARTEDGSIEAMSARLDEAIAKLDELLEGSRDAD